MAIMFARTPMDATMKSRTPSTMNSNETLDITLSEMNKIKLYHTKIKEDP